MIKLNDLTKKLNIDSIDEVIGRGGFPRIRKQDSKGWCDPYTSTSSEEEEEGTNNGGSGD